MRRKGGREKRWETGGDGKKEEGRQKGLGGIAPKGEEERESGSNNRAEELQGGRGKTRNQPEREAER